MKNRTLIVDYTNLRGTRSARRIRPISIDFTSNKWHPEPQWIMDAVDLDTNEVRSFAMASIHGTLVYDDVPDSAFYEALAVLATSRQRLPDLKIKITSALYGPRVHATIGNIGLDKSMSWDEMQRAHSNVLAIFVEHVVHQLEGLVGKVEKGTK